MLDCTVSKVNESERIGDFLLDASLLVTLHTGGVIGHMVRAIDRMVV